MAAMAAQEASAQGTDIQKSLSEGTPMCVLNDFDMQNDARQAHGAGVNLRMNIASANDARGKTTFYPDNRCRRGDAGQRPGKRRQPHHLRRRYG